MERRRSSGAIIHSTSQEIPCLFWNPQIHYRVHKDTQLVLILSQMSRVYIFPSYFPKIKSNIILPSAAWSSKWILPFRLPDQHFVTSSNFSYRCYIPDPFHTPRFDFPNNMWSSVQVTKLLIMKFSPVSYRFLPLRSKYSP
jgi:hypothetical protein